MILSIPLLAARCIPPDFVNPFLPWRLPPAICAVLLLAVFLAMPRAFRAVQRTRYQMALAAIVGISALAVTAIAAIILGASLSFVPWCSPFDDREMELQAQLARATPNLVRGAVGMTVILLLAVAGSLLYARRPIRANERGQSRG